MIHSTAIIDDSAVIADDVDIGPYTVIGADVAIGSGTVIGPHVVINGPTTIGEQNQIFQFASIGEQPQDLKFHGETSRLEIGNRNTIREFVTMHRGTEVDNSLTRIGNDNLFMAYVHIAHDCVIGNNIIFANNATLGGHVNVDDDVVIGGVSAVHQFVRIGRMAIIGGCSKVVQDIPPFALCDGRPAKTYGINLVGLRRSKISKRVIRQLSRAFKILFRSELTMSSAMKKLKAENKDIKEELLYLIDFMNSSKRGISR